MKRYKIVGVTGPTGSGKTTVCTMLKNSFSAIIDTDLIAREVVGPGEICLKTLTAYFGNDILNFDGTLNRKKLAAEVFISSEKLELLNSITHPFIFKKTLEKINENANCRIIYIDAPLLIESNIDKICDYIITVTAPKDLRLTRITSRDKISELEAQKRINSQKSDEFYISKSDFIVDGSKSIDEIKIDINKIINEILRK